MVKYLRIQLLLLILFIGQSFQGCANLTERVSSSPGQTPTAISIPTVVSVTNTPTPLVPFQEQLSCWAIMPLNIGGDIKGSLLFTNPEQDFAWDINSFQTKLLDKNTQTEWERPIVSLDGKVIASLPHDENKLAFTSYDGSKIFTLPKNGTYKIQKFLANGALVIEEITPDFWVKNYNDNNSPGLNVPYYIFDPAAEKFTAYSVYLPYFTFGIQGSLPFDFSPDMRYVVYQNGSSSDGQAPFTLIDLKTGETIWSELVLPPGMVRAWGDMPFWKPNTNTLIGILWSDEYNHYGNYYSIPLDGSVVQLTRFDKTYLSNLGNGGLTVPSWSQDGRYMVFRVADNNSGIYIWDNDRKTVYKPCLPDEGQTTGHYSFYWSFDSRYLFMRLSYPNATPTVSESPNPSRDIDIILDMATKTIWQLPDESNRGEYPSNKLSTTPWGWVNWDTP